jgi:hypothetical protein
MNPSKSTTKDPKKAIVKSRESPDMKCPKEISKKL